MSCCGEGLPIEAKAERILSGFNSGGYIPLILTHSHPPHLVPQTTTTTSKKYNQLLQNIF